MDGARRRTSDRRRVFSGVLPKKIMRAIWKGAISFGLVHIPISLFPATRREEFRFRLLRASDLSPVNYKRVAEADGKEVPWEQIVKGYEYKKGEFVVLRDEDFQRVDIEATQTVDIMHFVVLEEVDPLLFYKPYYMEASKGGTKAYILLREALEDTGKIAITKVVIKTRQHLAAIKPQKNGLMLELMHFPDEIIDASEFKAPASQAVAKSEMAMAKQLIKSMSAPWRPQDYNDDYRNALEKMIQKKIARGGKSGPPLRKKKQPSNVIDLVAILKKSVQEAEGGHAKTSTRKSSARRKAA
jgi:DNA end-binding protein Ku